MLPAKSNPYHRLFVVLLLLICTRCERSHAPFPSEEGQWILGIPFIVMGDTLSHDNRIYESPNFLTFSDASSDEVKRRYSRMAEESLLELLLAFEISSPAELGITDQSSKLTIFSNRYLDYRQRAFEFGFVLYGEDSPVFLSWHLHIRERFKKENKHETMHVVQYLLGVSHHRLADYEYPDFWFSEGLAEYVSGGAFPPILNVDQVNQWRQQEGHINPICIRLFRDCPLEYDRVGEYYPMFGLAVRYLMDEKGQGKTLMDVKRMYEDLCTDRYLFAEVFEGHMGMTIQTYEEHFFDAIISYLTEVDLAHIEDY